MRANRAHESLLLQLDIARQSLRLVGVHGEAEGHLRVLGAREDARLGRRTRQIPGHETHSSHTDTKHTHGAHLACGSWLLLA